MMWALRGTIVVNTTIAMVIAITVKSVYGLYLICRSANLNFSEIKLEFI